MTTTNTYQWHCQRGAMEATTTALCPHFPPPASVHHRRFSSASLRRISACSVSVSSPLVSTPSFDRLGGKMVAELVGAFTDLTERMGSLSNTTPSSQLLFKCLKLSIPLLQAAGLAPDGRNRLTRAMSVASLLADLQMDAEVISAGILRETLESGLITMHEIKTQIGLGPASLLHESLRIKHVPMKYDILDEESASALRKFCLTFYDIRALILELALKLDTMQNLSYLPKCHQMIKSLEVMKIYAPLAHAIGTGPLSLELEDFSFRYLFPSSYRQVDAWLADHETESKLIINSYKDQLVHALNADHELQKLVNNISISGRYKSRFSTMKKLLKDGRKPEQVNDILGLRIILDTKSDEWGPKACYKTYEIIQKMFKEIPNRTKDYIAKPKKNGYKSLHLFLDVSEIKGEINRPLMEVQIRTVEMDRSAVGGPASHSLYKGGFTDPSEGKRLKAIMLAAAELAALRLRDLPDAELALSCKNKNQVFCLLDKNKDGRISIEELTEVMEELGAGMDDARDLMIHLDANSDGSLSSDEFDSFQQQVQIMRNMEDKDSTYSSLLREKLQMTDNAGLIQVYRKELGDKLILRQ